MLGNVLPFESYLYAADGTRIHKSAADGGYTEYVSFGGQTLAERLSDGSWKDYIFANGQIIARSDTFTDPLNAQASTTFYHHGPIGSVEVLTDGSGALISSSQFLPFGTEISAGVNSNHYKFTGKERDTESGLDYFGARYYASSMGRFASADPYEIVLRKNQGKTPNEQKQLLDSFIANPQAWNKYAYGLNNPLKNIDIGGNCSAPAGLRGGQTGVCVEAFIAAARIGGVGLGDNRSFNPNGGTYRFRVDVRVDPGTDGGVSVNKDAGYSKVGFEGLNFGARGTGDVTLGPVTTDADGNRHFEVTGSADNGFEAVNHLGTISFDLKFTAAPDGTVTLDKAMGTRFPSIESYTYNSYGHLTGTLLQAPERQSGDLKKPQQCIGGGQCPQ